MLEIDGVNGINGVQNPYLSSNTKVEKTVVNHSRPIYPNNPMRGLEALSVYNAAMLIKEFPAEKEPLPLIYNPEQSIDLIQGERILSSDGNLVGIKSNNDKTETYYTIEDNEVKAVSVTDTETGKEIRSQHQISIDGEKSIEVIENSLSNDSVHKATWYKNGIPQEVNINKDLSGDKYIGVNYYIDTKGGNYYFDTPDEHAWAEVNDKQQITRIHSHYEKNGLNITRTANLYNGNVVSTSVEKQQSIPNMAGLELANIPELKPAEKYVADENVKSMSGDRTYYSNGMIEKNKLPNGVTYYYSPKGDLSKVVDGNKTITYIGEAQEISEDLGDNKTKITTLFKDGYEVLLKNDEQFKEVRYIKNAIRSYREAGIDADKGEQYTKELYFDSNGMLKTDYEF